ncbi:desulfoferrodoxin [Candidatus Pacearchaeota archaeon]|nr:desulfoferrodoxin [Candidatus Pacearchaeota archaeon]
MTNQKEVYKCNVCGNIIEVIHASTGTLVCCGQSIQLLHENTVDASLEKHVPIIEHKDGKIIVKVGSVEHPMLPEHYIEFIELIADSISYKKFLKPGEKPEAEFCISAKHITAREYCNLHGLWKNK